MIKPLIKIIPALSGNMKLSCMLDNFTKVDNNTYKAIARSARLYPLSSESFQNLIDINLYTGSWEFDIVKFYKLYSDIFYKDTFSYNKNDLLYINDFHMKKTINNLHFLHQYIVTIVMIYPIHLK